MVLEGDRDRVIVVGSGPAGAAAAQTLSARGIRVLLLEAGGGLPGGLLVRVAGRTVFKQTRRWASMGPIVPSGDPSTVWYSELAAGGLSNHWTGAVPRYSPEDFLDGQRLGIEHAWPITYDDLAPFYSRIERLMGVSGAGIDFPAVPGGTVAYRVALPKRWRGVARAAERRGFGLLPAPLAAGPPWMIRRGTTAFNSFASLINPLLRSGQVDCRLNTRAIRIHLDGAGRPRVECDDAETGGQIAFDGAAVVLAAGAINTARILLQSRGAGSQDGLGNGSGVLGAYLHDHLHVWFVLRLAKPLPRLRHIAHLSREPYATSAPLEATQVTVGGRVSSSDRLLSAVSWPSNDVGASVFGTMVPTRLNRVQLIDGGRQPGPDQAIEIRLAYSDEAIANAKRAVPRLLEVLDDAGFAPTVTTQSDILQPGSSVHFGGTARMHASSQYGVVDRYNHLHECPNVLVVDSSAFTTCVEKNPTLTAMALAARAAEHLAACLQRRAEPGV